MCVFVSAAETEDVCIVERLFSSSLVAIVSLKAPRKLKVCHFKKGTEICNYSYSNTILAVKLNRQVGRPGHRLLEPAKTKVELQCRDMLQIKQMGANQVNVCVVHAENQNCFSLKSILCKEK